MVRIRYKKNESTGHLHSKPILAGVGAVVVTLDPNSNSYAVSSYDSGEVLHQGTASNLDKAKKLAKTVLKELGVMFDDEVRQSVSERLQEEMVQDSGIEDTQR